MVLAIRPCDADLQALEADARERQGPLWSASNPLPPWERRKAGQGNAQDQAGSRSQPRSEQRSDPPKRAPLTKRRSIFGRSCCYKALVNRWIKLLSKGRIQAVQFGCWRIRGLKARITRNVEREWEGGVCAFDVKPRYE